jgi:hypothetical protein
VEGFPSYLAKKGRVIGVPLNDAQKDGLACVICNTDFNVSDVPSTPVGRSETGSQIFACLGCVAESKEVSQ